jgi:succinoglycan biosynthesis protein ExoM
MIVSILIPTFRRNNLLAQAVRSCLNQCNIASKDYEIVVVDNCSNKSAQHVVENLKDAQATVLYVHEPRQGVAVARNTAVSVARGDYIAFLDDDECATSNWLSELLKHGLQGAAAVFGPIHETVDDNLKDKRDTFDFSIVRRYFNRVDGDDISDCLYDLGTGNSLFNKHQCFGAEEPFDERHNFLGGEDIEFLSRLRNRKVRFTWAAKAWVNEYVPEERLTTRYLMKRRFHAGQVRTIVASKSGRFGTVQVLLWMAVGGMQILYYSVRYLIAFLRRRDTSNCAARIAGGAGKLVFFLRQNNCSST